MINSPFSTAGASRRLVLLATLSVFCACGGSSGSGTPPPPPPPAPGPFAGTYATVVTLVQNECTPVTVASNPTVVTHDASAGAITLTHAGTNYSGAAQGDGAFTTTPKPLNVGDGFQYVISIAGRFAGGALDALATVDRTPAAGGASCRFVVHWLGSR